MALRDTSGCTCTRLREPKETALPVTDSAVKSIPRVTTRATVRRGGPGSDATVLGCVVRLLLLVTVGLGQGAFDAVDQVPVELKLGRG